MSSPSTRPTLRALERKVGQLTMKLDLVKKLRVSRSPATAGTPPSSPFTDLFCQMGMQNDRSPEKQLLLRINCVSLEPWGYRTRCNHRGHPGRAPLLSIPTCNARASAARPPRQSQAGRWCHAGQRPRNQATQALCVHDRQQPRFTIYPNLYHNVIPARPDMVWVADFIHPYHRRLLLSGQC